MSKKSKGADKEFIIEAEELIGTLGKEMLRYEEALMGPGDVNPEILNNISRAVHALKGSANLLGYGDLGQLAHSLEVVLDLMRLGKVKPETAVLDTIFSAIESLNGLLVKEDVEILKAASVQEKLESLVPAEAKQHQFLKELKDWLVEIFLIQLGLPKDFLGMMHDDDKKQLTVALSTTSSSVFIIGLELKKTAETVEEDLTNQDEIIMKFKDWLEQQGKIIAIIPIQSFRNSKNAFLIFILTSTEDQHKLKEAVAQAGGEMAVIKEKTV